MSYETECMKSVRHLRTNFKIIVRTTLQRIWRRRRSSANASCDSQLRMLRKRVLTSPFLSSTLHIVFAARNTSKRQRLEHYSEKYLQMAHFQGPTCKFLSTIFQNPDRWLAMLPSIFTNDYNPQLLHEIIKNKI